MTPHNPTLRDVCSLADAKNEIEAIGSDPNSIKIMAPKMILKIIKLENVVLQDAIIIKQDMLSIGGEVAIPKDAFELRQRRADILVIGTLTQLRGLIGKLKRHYPRIRTVAADLAVLLKKIR